MPSRARLEEFIAVVEAGVLNGDLQTAAAKHGLFWAPDPSSAPFCTVGGNLAFALGNGPADCDPLLTGAGVAGTPCTSTANCTTVDLVSVGLLLRVN